MAVNQKIFASLDIGSNYVKGVVAEISNGKLFVLATSSIRALGIVDGTIVNEIELQNCVKKCVSEMESVIGFALKKFIVAIPDSNVTLKKLSGATYLTSADSIITNDDITRAMVFSSYNFNEPENEIINVVPFEYIVNDTVVRNPVGLRSQQLALNAMGVVSPKAVIYPILRIIEDCGYEIIEMCVAQIAEKYEIASQFELEGNVVLVNLGYYSSSISIHQGSQIKGIGSIKRGASDIVEELCEKYAISMLVARDLLNEIGAGFKTSHDFFKTVEVVNIEGEQLQLDKDEISTFVNHKLLQILQIIKQEILKFDDMQFDLIVLSGGLTEIIGFDKVMSRVFEKNTKKYEARYLGGRNSAFVVCLGLIRFTHEKFENRSKMECSFSEEEIKDFIRPKKKMREDDNVLSKIFGYFFE